MTLPYIRAYLCRKTTIYLCSFFYSARWKVSSFRLSMNSLGLI